MLKKPKALLFDFDGVVVDSFEVHYNAWSSAFKTLFGTKIPEFPHDTYAGKSPLLIAEFFSDTIGRKSQAKELYALKDKHLKESLLSPKLLPGVHEIQEFAAQFDIPHGIASNATRQFLKKSITQLSLNFKVFYGFEDYTYPKPHPEAYITLAKHIGVPQKDFKQCWVFEDSLVGLSAAKEAGMLPVGIKTQYNDIQLRDAGALLIYPTLKEAYQELRILFKT
ncbi:HAD family hydrolase [Aquimarina addita]|uniref:HAD family hydrolase n=1 Tax=Aquimarina addita TaxID=870485 RepID=A0ABP6UMJ9_9FLAO